MTYNPEWSMTLSFPPFFGVPKVNRSFNLVSLSRAILRLGIVGCLGILSATAPGCGVAKSGARSRIPLAYLQSAQNASHQDLVKSVDAASETLQIMQPLDRTQLKAGTYQQRVFVNTTFARGTNAPVMLHLCGEWECSSSEMVSALLEKAKETGAVMVAFEHRFYGKSQPASELPPTVERFKYLSMTESLADFADAQKEITRLKGFSGNWVVQGCSYAGTMAAAYRIQYPELVKAAYACSAPVKASPAGFHTYDTWSANAVSPECRANSQRVTGFIHQLAQAEGVDAASRLMQLPLLAERVEDIDSILVTVLPQFAQYGKIDALCSAVANTDSAEAVKALVTAMKGLLGDAYYGESFVGAREKPLDVLWLFQTCREATWHYSTSIPGQPTLFPFELKMDYYTEMCRRLYGAGIDNLRTDFISKLEQSLLSGTASNIFFSNGEIDPWTDLSFSTDIDKSRNLFGQIIQKGSHCDGMYESFADATPETQRIMTLVNEFLAKFLDSQMVSGR